MAKKTSAAHSDCFLEIEGIEGESTDKDHPKAIEIEGFSFGAASTVTSAKAHGVAKASVKDIIITAYTSSASPSLFQASLEGQVFDSAKLTCRKAGSDQQEYLVIEMENVLISSFNVGNSHNSDDAPMDHFTLSFGKIMYKHHPQKDDGSLGAANVMQWNLQDQNSDFS